MFILQIMIEVKSHHELSDIEFLKQFENCSLSPELFTHEAHLRLAWLHIVKYGINKAEKNIAHQIKKYVAFVGAQDKYNETVTIAGIKAVNHFIKCSTTINFIDFIKENNCLMSDFKGLLLSHYSTNIFDSDKAKTEFIEPELEAFQ